MYLSGGDNLLSGNSNLACAYWYTLKCSEYNIGMRKDSVEEWSVISNVAACHLACHLLKNIVRWFAPHDWESLVNRPTQITITHLANEPHLHY